MLTLVSRIPKTRPVKALYRCECGTEKVMHVSNVKSGASTSCGCYRVKMAREKMAANADAFASGNTVHGMSGTPTWNSWQAMIQRCTNPARDNFAYYGGRGIKFDDRWRDFTAFLHDMGERPEGTTLDRVDNDGDYTPDNCRWATMKAQSNNRRARGTARPVTE